MRKDFGQHKEYLSYHNIQLDLTIIYRKSLKNFCSAMSLILLLVCLVWFVTYVAAPSPVYSYVILFVMFAVVVGLSIGAISGLITIQNIKKNKFQVVEDKLIGKEDYRPQLGKWIGYKPHKLHFSSFGEYNIYPTEYYIWSKVGTIDAKGIFNSADIGDVFYIVQFNGENQMVYNTKLFELKD